eukprot:TRINITY_DN90832_c0_g1_i1.p1 TRINITY_DN90832_c0_g1~~TRINITY_DN90832_c0_g1_i1.p1  ORF type:complete len:682 (+),score=121.23 TRINITY_DN90832_c0_g1_i1:117-2162(+)
MGCCGSQHLGCHSSALALREASVGGEGSEASSSPRRPATLSSDSPSRGQRACGRTVNHFLALVRRGGSESVPSQLLHAYARYLGLEPEDEPELLWIAELAAKAPMPQGWTEHFDSQGRLFYYNAERRTSWWTHPLEDEHRSVHQRMCTWRSGSGEDLGDVGLLGLRRELWQLEAEVSEADLSWMEHFDQDGHVFYFNRRERLSSWTDPRPAIRHRLLLRQRAVRCLLGRPEPPEEEAPCLEVEPDRPAWLEEFDKKGSISDPWQSPCLLLMEYATECPVCYDPLYTSRPSVLTSSDGRRICGHYFCFSCAQRLPSGCPLCRAQAEVGNAKVCALPDVEKRPWQWFAMVDVDRDGRLEQAEAVHALEAVLPIDAERLRRALGIEVAGTSSLSREGTGLELLRENSSLSGVAGASGWWKEWLGEPQSNQSVAAGSGGISAEAFCAEGGMLQWIVENLGELRKAEQAGEPPELEAGGLEHWFDFWDTDCDGGLSKPELLRALMKTLRVSGVERKRVGAIRSTIEKCFGCWAHHSDLVSREAFLKPDGLGALLLNSLFERPLTPPPLPLPSPEGSGPLVPLTEPVAVHAPTSSVEDPLVRKVMPQSVVFKEATGRWAPDMDDNDAAVWPIPPPSMPAAPEVPPTELEGLPLQRTDSGRLTQKLASLIVLTESDKEVPRPKCRVGL